MCSRYRDLNEKTRGAPSLQYASLVSAISSIGEEFRRFFIFFSFNNTQRYLKNYSAPMSWRRNSFIFMLTFLIVSLSPSKSQQPTEIHTRKVDESCERDIQCIVHAFCRYQQTCLCDEFFAPSLDKASCHVTAGASCFEAEGCPTMANAECRQNVCTCKDNYMIDMNNSSNCIIRPTHPGDHCQRNDDCSDSMEMALCISGNCTCYTDHRFVNETGTCLKMRGLYQPCKKDYECFVDEKSPNGLVCRNGECACREGEASCNKGALIYQPILFVLAMLLLGTVARSLT